MDIKTLKAIGKAESELLKMKVEVQKKDFMEFSDDPEVAKVLDYMTRYNQLVPSNHPIYNYIQEIRNSRNNKELAKRIVKDNVFVRMDARKKQRDEESEKIEMENKGKRDSIKKELNGMLENLEKETDRIFEFITNNQSSFYGDSFSVSSMMKTRRFLISMKNGYKYAKMI